LILNCDLTTHHDACIAAQSADRIEWLSLGLMQWAGLPVTK
jgi:hypothetical protein